MTITPLEFSRGGDVVQQATAANSWLSGMPLASMLLGLGLLLAAGTIILRVWLVKRHERRDPLDTAFRGVARRTGLTPREVEAVRLLASRLRHDAPSGSAEVPPVVLLLSPDALARATMPRQGAGAGSAGGSEGGEEPPDAALVSLSASIQRKSARETVAG
jgi:hypothetical protein